MAADAEAPIETPQEGEKRGLMGTIAIVAVVLLVIVAECALAYMFIPDIDEARVLAEARLASLGKEDLDEAVTPSALLDAESAVEIDLGEFSLSEYDRASDTLRMIDFHLYCIVKKDEEARATPLLEKVKARIKEVVETIVRSSAVDDFDDDGLGVLKRKIRRQMNHLLGGELISDVSIVGFRYMQQ